MHIALYAPEGRKDFLSAPAQSGYDPEKLGGMCHLSPRLDQKQTSNCGVFRGAGHLRQRTGWVKKLRRVSLKSKQEWGKKQGINLTEKPGFP